MSVPSRLRFEVLRRDNHACRYCGAAAPGARLHVDHVVPEALGGPTTPDNLVTACEDCNQGKASTSPGEHLVADVAEDAVRWARAMQAAAEAAEAERAQLEQYRDSFLEEWQRWTYNDRGQRRTVELPGNWRSALVDVYRSGLTRADLADAVDVALGRRGVAEPFAYFLGVTRQLASQRQAVAAELLRRGAV